MSKPQTYAIIGTGALGGLYGGLLARHGFEVHFLQIGNRILRHHASLEKIFVVAAQDFFGKVVKI